MTQPIVEAQGLVKKYGALAAVNDVSFSIEEGEIFGLLGPNGAGKSTLIAMLTGLFPPDSGTIHILGCDAVSDADQVKHLIGVVPQELALYPTLSGAENLRFFGEIYGLAGKRLQERVESVLSYVAMAEWAKDPVRTYSGGMKRRLNMAVGLINNPRILFLDEPTVGVDPQSRNHIFESVERLNREQGMTILYTTHYMEEAERLCRRVAIIDHGKVIALDTPRNLIALLGGGIIQVGVAAGRALTDESLLEKVSQLSQVRAASWLPQGETGQPGEAPHSEVPHSESPDPEAPLSDASQPGMRVQRTLKVEAHQVKDALIQIIQLFNENNVEMLSVETLEPNLESVFLHLTGKSLRP
jgi:ABC-2 type transport system ATP-binding protein